MALLLPIGFLLLQAAALALLPEFAAQATTVFIALAPLLAALAVLARARAEVAPARGGWWLVAAALVIWAGGAGVNVWHEVVLEAPQAVHRASMLGFNLAAVPLLYLLASEWHSRARWGVHGVDAVLALVLGGAYFLFTWALLTAPAAPVTSVTPVASDATGINLLLWLHDAQNLFVAVAALVRWLAATDERENDLFRAITAYALAYLVFGVYNNHFLSADVGGGAIPGAVNSINSVSPVITVVFALLAALALLGPRGARGARGGQGGFGADADEIPGALPDVLAGAPLGLWPDAEARRALPGAAPTPSAWRPSIALVRAVRSVRPLFLAGALLLVSLFLIRIDYAFGTAGVLMAVLGYALRSTVAQVRDIERVDGLQRDRSALQSIVWTDALTGIANRRFLDQALSGAGRRELLASQPLSVLMIDIDHFKLLNDARGHLAGDACLRAVAQALRQALVRPGDVLARYGGEEFIVLLQEAGSTGAIVVAERLRCAVEALRIAHPAHSPGVVTVSIGAASAASQGRASTESLIAAADKALYEAKSSGRNQVRGLTVALP